MPRTTTGVAEVSTAREDEVVPSHSAGAGRRSERARAAGARHRGEDPCARQTQDVGSPDGIRTRATALRAPCDPLPAPPKSGKMAPDLRFCCYLVSTGAGEYRLVRGQNVVKIILWSVRCPASATAPAAGTCASASAPAGSGRNGSPAARRVGRRRRARAQGRGRAADVSRQLRRP